MTTYVMCHATAALMLVILLQSSEAMAESIEASCGPVSVTDPVQFEIHAARPLISWVPVPNATAYRVKVDSRVPQGEKVFAADTQVTTASFLPASPLAEARAKVRVEITPLCREGPGVSVLRQFYIDLAPICGSVTELRLEQGQGRRWLSWRGPPGALRYGAWAYAPDTGNLLAAAELRDSKWALPEELRGPAIISIRPQCSLGQGEFSFFAL